MSDVKTKTAGQMPNNDHSKPLADFLRVVHVTSPAEMAANRAMTVRGIELMNASNFGLLSPNFEELHNKIRNFFRLPALSQEPAVKEPDFMAMPQALQDVTDGRTTKRPPAKLNSSTAKYDL